MEVVSTSAAAATFPAFTLCPFYDEAYREDFLQEYGLDRQELDQEEKLTRAFLKK